jgi:hypothetical protein
VFQNSFLAAVIYLLLWFGGLMAAFLATVFLMVFFMDKPFGVQIVSLFAETEFVVFLVFCNSRSWHGYSLRNKTVQQQLPHLLRIHGLFVGLIFVVLTMALSAIPHLPDIWFAENVSWTHNFVRHQSSPFAFVLILAGSVAAVTEASILRKVLSRALESAAVSPGGSAVPYWLVKQDRDASNKLNRWQILGWGMFCTGLLLTLLGYSALENRFYLTSPQQPNPETGRVYPYNVSQGIVFYQTLAEKQQLDALKYASGFLAFGGIALALWKAPRKRHHSI